MRNFLNKNDILTASQNGFKTNISTELAITTLHDKLLDNLNNPKFDTVQLRNAVVNFRADSFRYEFLI